MAQIKTAVELALERTQGLKSDRAGIEAQEARRTGRVLGARFLEDPSQTDLKKELSKLPKSQEKAAREGAVEALLARIQLPRDKDSLPPLQAVAAGLGALSPGLGADKRALAIAKDLQAFMERYLEDASQMEEGLARQYAPKLRQKEQEMSRRTGQDVRIDPRRDPEFLALLSRGMGQLKGQYQEALDRAKEDMKAMCLG